MKRGKAPGPDGFNTEFFLATWDIIGTDSCNVVLDFFAHFNLHKSLTTIGITLIPRTHSPTSISDIRPISLCTTAYKCVSKIIVDRLKIILPDIIDKAQSAFIPGRLISDNIILAQEFFGATLESLALPNAP